MRLPQFDVLAVTLTAAVLWLGMSGCLGPAGEDEECGEFSHGELVHCEERLVCSRHNGDSPGTGRCIRPGALDETCWEAHFEWDTCEPGLYCDLGGNSGTCDVQVRAGEPCFHDVVCLGGLICNQGYEPAICSEQVQEGEPCARQVDCVAGLSCNEASGTGICRAPGPEGALCANNADCVGDGLLLCAPSEDGHQRCVPRREKGETCTSDAVCGTWVCNRAYDPPRCADDGRLGDPCGRPEECFYADVCNTALDPPQCASYATEGEPCADDDHCAKWLVCDTQSAEPRCVPR